MIRGFGTLLNIVTVLAGGTFGLAVGSKFSKSLHQAVLNVIGLVSVFIGISMALQSKNILILLTSLIIGVIIGELLKIDDLITNVGINLEKRFAKGEKGLFAKAFVTTSILFCVGPLTILGSIQDGLSGDYKLLATKSMLDGFTAIAFASGMGVGVLFTVFTILIVQGGITLFAGLLSGVLTTAVIAELTGVGGIMIVSTGLNMLEIKKIKTANMLPALVVVPIIVSSVEKFIR